MDEEEQKVFLYENIMLQQNMKLSIVNTNQLVSTFNISFRSARRLWDQIKKIISQALKSAFHQERLVNVEGGGNCDFLKAAIHTINYKERKLYDLYRNCYNKKGTK